MLKVLFFWKKVLCFDPRKISLLSACGVHLFKHANIWQNYVLNLEFGGGGVQGGRVKALANIAENASKVGCVMITHAHKKVRHVKCAQFCYTSV